MRIAMAKGKRVAALRAIVEGKKGHQQERNYSAHCKVGKMPENSIKMGNGCVQYCQKHRTIVIALVARNKRK